MFLVFAFWYDGGLKVRNGTLSFDSEAANVSFAVNYHSRYRDSVILNCVNVALQFNQTVIYYDFVYPHWVFTTKLAGGLYLICRFDVRGSYPEYREYARA